MKHCSESTSPRGEMAHYGVEEEEEAIVELRLALHLQGDGEMRLLPTIRAGQMQQAETLAIYDAIFLVPLVPAVL